MIFRKQKTVFSIIMTFVMCGFLVWEAQAQDNIDNLIQSLKEAPGGAAASSVQSPGRPESVGGNVYSTLSRPVDKAAYTGKKISLDLQDADVVNVLRLIADIGGVNIVFGADVSGKVTVNLKNIPWDQALDIILMTNGLDKVVMGKIIRIARSETITEEANKRLAAKKASDKVEPLVTRIIPVNYSDIATIKESDLIKNILSERGKIDFDARTNTLIVHDIAKSVSQIETLVRRLDTRIPQVLIEARIVEANDGFAREFGIQWGAFYGDFTGDTVSNVFGGNQGPSTFDQLGFLDPDPEFDQPLFNVNLPATDVLPTPGILGFNLAKITSDSVTALDIRLSAAEASNLAKVVSSPRIMTVDNQEANIVQGEDIPYLSVSQDGTQVQFVEANLELLVTPHVTAENTILLDVETHRDAPNFDQTIQGQPAITRNKAQTSVLLSDGETTVIGGIFIVEDSKNRNGIPFLMDIPYLGRFFRYEKVEQEKKELLVFLTPKIIR
jgi:type IV pilus assembly protein PilQ